nr:hypothetical protein Iba_chr02dCG0060 [Ipomoea batatas]
MARANGGRRSKRWVSGRAILSAASGSVGAAGYSAHAWSFKRRSFRRTPISVVCEGCDSAGVLRGFWYEVEGGVGSAGVLCSGRFYGLTVQYDLANVPVCVGPREYIDVGRNMAPRNSIHISVLRQKKENETARSQQLRSLGKLTPLNTLCKGYLGFDNVTEAPVRSSEVPSRSPNVLQQEKEVEVDNRCSNGRQYFDKAVTVGAKCTGGSAAALIYVWTECLEPERMRSVLLPSIR